MFPHTPNAESRRTSHWMDLARAHDRVLHLHCLRVSELSACFSAYLRLPIPEQRSLTRAGLLHDVGKIKIPAAVLKKSTPLTAEEVATVQTRTQLGYEVLIEGGETDETVLAVARNHHERLDGSGYPRRLTVEHLSLPVRMVTLCDVFAAMTELRPYAEEMPWDEALSQMALKRTRLDLELLVAFATMATALYVPTQRFSLFLNRTRRSA